MKIQVNDVIVPMDVPKKFRETYIRNYLEITKESGHLMLFAGDQKVEHLNKDFGDGIPPMTMILNISFESQVRQKLVYLQHNSVL